MSGTGPKIRNVGAIAYNALLNMASTNLGVPVASLTVKGVVVRRRQDRHLRRARRRQAVQPRRAGTSRSQPVLHRRSRCRPTRRSRRTRTRSPGSTSPQKVTGEYTYVHQVRVPGMLHGRMVRPRGQGAYPYNSNVPVSVDATSIAHIPGAKVVQVNNFLGVVAPKEYDAIQAAAQLKVVWNTNPILPGTGNLWTHYRQLDSAGSIARDRPTKGQRRHGARLVGPHGVGHLQAPLPGAHADRPELLQSPTSRRPTRRSGATPRTSTAS